MDEFRNDQEFSPKKKPFKLCFIPKNLLGRSDIRIGKPTKDVKTVTPKFYRKDEQEESVCPEVLKKHLEQLEMKGPKEKYLDPITENQKYGWYQEVFCDFTRHDRRLNFAKNTNRIVKEHLMNYENIR